MFTNGLNLVNFELFQILYPDIVRVNEIDCLFKAIGLLLRQFGDRLFQITFEKPEFCGLDTEPMGITPVTVTHENTFLSFLPNNGSEIHQERDTIAIQPLTISFLLFYIILIVIQFLCLIWHRLKVLNNL